MVNCHLQPSLQIVSSERTSSPTTVTAPPPEGQHQRVRTTLNYPSRSNNLLTPNGIRFILSPANNPSAILNSPHYQPYKENLYHPVPCRTFSGYWIIQSSFTTPSPPKDSDLTIYFLHGGGYFCSQSSTYLLFLLRIAESLIAAGSSVSVFSLDYRLAPEHPFPAQFEDAMAAYAYLLEEMQISPSKLVVMGDSAGGHLALSLLNNLHQPMPGLVSPTTEGRRWPKPWGLTLLSPWMSLHHYSSPSFTRNADNDVLSVSFLRQTACRFLGSTEIPEAVKSSPQLEFLSPDPPADWDAILPARVWVTAGDKEIFFDDVAVWVQKLKGSLKQGRVTFEAGVGKVHDWQWLETMDEGLKRDYLRQQAGIGRTEGFESIDAVTMAIRVAAVPMPD